MLQIINPKDYFSFCFQADWHEKGFYISYVCQLSLTLNEHLRCISFLKDLCSKFLIITKGKMAIGNPHT